MRCISLELLPGNPGALTIWASTRLQGSGGLWMPYRLQMEHPHLPEMWALCRSSALHSSRLMPASVSQRLLPLEPCPCNLCMITLDGLTGQKQTNKKRYQTLVTPGTQTQAGMGRMAILGLRAGRTLNSSFSFVALSRNTWSPEFSTSQWNERT